LGNIPMALAERPERVRPLATEFNGPLLSVLTTIFRGPLDQYFYFWIGQNLFFTLVFLTIFVIFSKLIRSIDHEIPAGTIPHQNG
jgi:hypothetical protein